MNWWQAWIFALGMGTMCVSQLDAYDRIKREHRFDLLVTCLVSIWTVGLLLPGYMSPLVGMAAAQIAARTLFKK